MKRTRMKQLAHGATLILAVGVLAAAELSAWGAEDKAPVKKPVGKSYHRLPAHYGSVVNEKQRKEIYKIQEEYQPKIEALKKQLDALKKERDEKISAVLTEEQRKRLKQAAAKRKSKSKDAPPAKPVEKEPSSSVEPKPVK
jgi:hypothetical protein